jgi:hypothetical protein
LATAGAASVGQGLRRPGSGGRGAGEIGEEVGHQPGQAAGAEDLGAVGAGDLAGGDGCAPGGHGEHARGQPVQAPVMGVPVQQQVRRLVPAEPAVQVVGVAQETNRAGPLRRRLGQFQSGDVVTGHALSGRGQPARHLPLDRSVRLGVRYACSVRLAWASG